MSVLVLHDVWVEYGGRSVLRGVSFELEGQGSVGVVGPSGSGKTTLLYTMAGLEVPARGTVTLLGRRLDTMAADRVAALRLRSLGFVFQQADLVPELTIEQNIALPLELNGVRPRATRARVRELLARLGLEECGSRRPEAVSGGQAQRAAIARAAAMRPSIIFADEPTGALDSANGDDVMELLLGQVAEDGALLVVVTHDEGVAARLNRRISVRDGVVTDLGRPGA